MAVLKMQDIGDRVFPLAVGQALDPGVDGGASEIDVAELLDTCGSAQVAIRVAPGAPGAPSAPGAPVRGRLGASGVASGCVCFACRHASGNPAAAETQESEQ